MLAKGKETSERVSHNSADSRIEGKSISLFISKALPNLSLTSMSVSCIAGLIEDLKSAPFSFILKVLSAVGGVTKGSSIVRIFDVVLKSVIVLFSPVSIISSVAPTTLPLFESEANVLILLKSKTVEDSIDVPFKSCPEFEFWFAE